MLTKFKINLIAILMCVCLTSVGFSAWTITAETQPVNVAGNINADIVIKSDEYVGVSNIVGFEYHKDGYVVNGAASNEATLSLTIEVNTQALKASFGNDINNVTVNFKLQSGKALYDASSRFKTFEIFNGCSVDYNNETLTANDNGMYNVNIALTNEPSQTFTVEYTLKNGIANFEAIFNDSVCSAIIKDSYPLEITIMATL